jgi:pimeloyl-ACP methyl ester carboxylesterase
VTDAKFFTSGSNQLAYRFDPAEATSIGILFVHAAGGNRLGPHRMFVELARRLNALGYSTFRFDLSGSGDSSGACGGIMDEAADVHEAVRFFRDISNVDTVVLLGISRGARVCYELTARHELPLAGMILLSIPVSTRAAALKTFHERLRVYWHKLRTSGTLRRLVSGKVYVLQVYKTLLHALGLASRFKPLAEVDLATRCPILFVYGGNDPIAGESRRHYGNVCQHNGLPHDCHIVTGANHSFFHYKWKEEIFAVSEKWLKSLCG